LPGGWRAGGAAGPPPPDPVRCVTTARMATLTNAQRSFLDEAHCGIATTLLPDGSPHSTVVWVDHDGEHLLFNTVRGHLKSRNLARDPRVSVAVFDPARPFQRTLVVRGRAELADDGADEHIDRLARKYTGQERYPWRRPGQRRVIVTVVAERITSVID
jgi:PPOX class probable F420-dependent enzyme